MAIKGTVTLTGNIQAGDLQKLFTAVSEAVFANNKSKVFSNIRLEELRNTLTFETAESKRSAMEFLDQAFKKMDHLSLHTCTEDTSERRALGYRITVGEIPKPAHA